MTDDGSDRRSDSSAPRMTTSFDPSLRTDARVLGLVVAVALSFVALIGYTSNDYGLAQTATLLAVASLSAVGPFVYGAVAGR